MITEREYVEGTTANRFFVGDEVEHSKFRGARTLFVIGVQPFEEIQENIEKYECSHVYLGANMSFDVNRIKAYVAQMLILTNSGIRVTLDFDHSSYESVICHMQIAGIDPSLVVLMASVKLPNISTFADSLFVKVDDVDFNASNKGVWVWSAKDLMNPEVETTWDKYTTDKVIE